MDSHTRWPTHEEQLADVLPESLVRKLNRVIKKKHGVELTITTTERTAFATECGEDPADPGGYIMWHGVQVVLSKTKPTIWRM